MLERLIIAVLIPLLERLFRAVMSEIVEGVKRARQDAARKRAKAKAEEALALIKSGDREKMLDGNTKSEESWRDHVDQ